MLSMYMVTHKDVDFIPEGRTPIFVGDGANEGNYLRDNTGDNIAYKNKNYCELTAYYWIWKNDHNSEYVSIEHYRRFFMSPFCLAPTIASVQQIENEIKKCGVITAKDARYSMSIRQFYKERHYIEDLLNAEEAIKKFYPKYIDSFNTVMNRDHMPLFNMLVLSKENFDKYCEWLFTILFYVESRTDLSGRTEYQQRAYGFLAERLMGVWIEENELQVRKNDIYYVFPSRFRSVLSSMKRRIPNTIKPKGPRS